MSAAHPAEAASVVGQSTIGLGRVAPGAPHRHGAGPSGAAATATATATAASLAAAALASGVSPRRRHPALCAVKRSIDILASFLGLVLTAPVVALLAVIIRLDSRGSVLFHQTRIGRDGRPFQLIKLRSMHDDARVTRVGRFLRPMGLDELPQLWNVLVGDMSVVGPRPERPHLVAEYEETLPGYAHRHVVRPGITGWAQIHGLRGGERPISERLLFDLEYVRTWNPALDLLILALTLSAVWRDTRRELRQ